MSATSECVNLLDKKALGGNMGLVIDFMKAFETVECSFATAVWF